MLIMVHYAGLAEKVSSASGTNRQNEAVFIYYELQPVK